MENNDTLFVDLLNKVHGRNITVLSYNIRSMRENFEFFIMQFGPKNVMPDVIILTEIWIFENEVNNFKIPGYKSFHNCNQSYRSGGVIIFVLEDLSCSESVIDSNTADMLHITINFDTFSLSVLAIYRLHSHTIFSFINELQNILYEIKSKNLLLIGDLNICILENTTINSDYISLLSSFGLDSLINTPTRITRESKSCIDHAFFRSRDNFEHTSGSIELGITDHLAIFCAIEIPEVIIKKSLDITTKKIDYERLLNILRANDYNSVFIQTDVNLAYNKLSGIIDSAILQSTDVKQLTRRYNKLKPWMTKNLIKHIEKRKLLYKKTLKYPDNQNYKNHYNRFHKKLLSDLKLQKELYYNNLFEVNKNNSSAQWKIVNELTGVCKDKNADMMLYSDESHTNIVSEPQDVANLLNGYYISIVDKLRVNNIVMNKPQDYQRWFPTACNLKSMFLFPTDPQEISSIISSLKSKKSPGNDGWSPELLKNICTVISHVLAYIVNLSMQSGVFPDKLKDALVVPVFKKGDTKLLGNYRPISLLPVMAKVIEKVVKKRLLSFYSKFSFFSENQLGFIEGKSTEDALVKVLTELQNGLNDNRSTAGVFIDITKAFDCVDHQILLEKLSISGVRGIPLQWFKSYLSERKQRVRVGNCVSEPLTVKYGVPQGSVLGPILFLVYINDLCEGKLNGKITAFADDTALTYCTKPPDNLTNQIQADLNILKYWFDSNYMSLSTSKSKYLLFSHRGTVELGSSLYYKCNDCVCKDIVNTCHDCTIIDRCDHIKYLGVVIDDKINWKMQISKLNRETLYLVRKFYFLRYVCPLSVLKTIYYALVNSKLQYGITLWGGTYYTSLKPLVKAQKKIIRVMLFKGGREKSFPLFSRLQILPLRHLYVYQVTRIFYAKSGNTVSNINVYFQKLRNRQRTVVPRPYTEAYKKSYNYLASKIWNKINPPVNDLKSRNIFKRYIRKYLLNLENIEEWFRLL